MTVDFVAPVVRVVEVARSPEDAFGIFTDQIGDWWPYGEHCVYGDQSAGVAFVDGVIVETSVTGERCAWGEVTVWEPPHRVAFTWHPGSEDDTRTEVEVTFATAGEGTRVELTHRGWEALGERAVAARSGYDQGWRPTLAAFVAHADSRTRPS